MSRRGAHTSPLLSCPERSLDSMQRGRKGGAEKRPGGRGRGREKEEEGKEDGGQDKAKAETQRE